MKEIKNYKGEEENFKKLINKLNEPINLESKDESNKYDKIKYVGKKKNNKYEGRGILYDENNNIKFNGFFKNYEYEGFGNLYENNILIYEGYFHNGKYNGKGIFYEYNNKKYEGNFVDGQLDGIGIEYYIYGKRKMEYKEGKPSKECYGILYDYNNQEIYEGILIDQRPEQASNASILYENGNLKYYGNFINFKYNGKGLIYYEKSNGKIYFDGMFIMDECVNGVLYDPYGIKIYEGEFINNNPKEVKNIKLSEYDENLKYEGEILNGQYSGFGKLYHGGINYKYYEGFFLNGLFDGKGILFDFIEEDHLDKKYEGEFKNGLFHGFGKGKLYKKNDFALYLFYEGYFIKGKFEGNGKIYYQAGHKYLDGEFINNEIIGKGIKYYISG